MKAFAVYYIVIIAVFSIDSFGQSINKATAVATTPNTASMPDNSGNDDRIIEGYYVVETINKTFGRSVTEYKVSRLSMISTYDLGPQNTRTITPIYGRPKNRNTRVALGPKALVDPAVNAFKSTRMDAIYRKSKEKPDETEPESKAFVDPAARFAKDDAADKRSKEKITNVKPESEAIATVALKPIKTDSTVTKAKEKIAETAFKSKTAAKHTSPAFKPVNVGVIAPTPGAKSLSIDVVKTYAKVLDKGYKSIEMLTRVGDRAYFDGDSVTAVKCYSELFSMTKNLDPVYYYRYAQSLKGINQMEQADAMMKLFEIKNLTYKVAKE
ncbi:hypothetical protein [Flavobacterium sp. FlaQc-48]|uniref:hypothetical protein n=1 Tax=Flavobacterium sp. FlaQc-48 TaxID=3374181 RepID=UPI00375777C1